MQKMDGGDYVLIGLFAITSPLWGPLWLIGRLAAYVFDLK
jgi:hypothetical protein